MRSEGLWENLLASMLPFSNFRYNCLLHNRSLFRRATAPAAKSRKGHLEIFSRPQDIENYRLLVIFASPNRYFKKTVVGCPWWSPFKYHFWRKKYPFLIPGAISRLIVCWTTVLSLVTQRTSPQRGALRDETKETTAVEGARICSTYWVKPGTKKKNQDGARKLPCVFRYHGLYGDSTFCIQFQLYGLNG